MDMMTYTNFLLYIVIWWLTLFTVLPWGLRPVVNQETGESTPAKPRLPLKFFITTILAGGLWMVAKWMIANNVLGGGS